MECVEFKAVLSIKARDKRQIQMSKIYVLLMFVKYEQGGLRITESTERRLQQKLQKEKSYQGAGLSKSFFSSPGGIEETSRLMLFFFIQQ